MDISSALQALIVAEAALAPRVEVCGLLLGRQLRVVEVRSCRNVSQKPADNFEIDPAQLLAAHRAARAGAANIIGCYHSHPNGRAYPSERDLAAAEMGSVWMIVAGGQLTAWLRGQTGFTQLVV